MQEKLAGTYADYTDDTDDTDDDPPTMPTLDLALARLEAENPAAATAARAYLAGEQNKSTRIHMRVSVAEHAQITETAKALGYGSVSEFLRARALA